MSKPPLVSVTVCIYNGEACLSEALHSVLAQTFTNFELICLDDGSRDRSADIVRAMRDPRIRYEYQENRGLGAARRRCIELAAGKYVALLDQDDVWLPTKLERQIRFLESHHEYGLVYSDCLVIDGNGQVIKRHSQQVRPVYGHVLAELLLSSPIMVSTTIFPRTVLEAVGSFRDYRMCEEYDLFLRVAARYPIGYLEEPLAKYRVHPTSTSQRMRDVQLRETLEILDKWERSEIGKSAYVRCQIHFARAMIYGFVGRQLMYADGDRGLARRYLRESLRHRWHPRPVLDCALSFLPTPLLLRARQSSKQLLRYF